MSIEQTNQLLQLILNALLLVMACTIALSGMLMRHTSVSHRLRMTQQEYRESIAGDPIGNQVYLSQFKTQLRYLRQNYRLTHFGVLIGYYALFFSIASTLALTLRTLLNFDALIHLSFVLFLAGIITLLFSIGLTVFNLHQSHHSLRQEIHWMLTVGLAAPGTAQPRRWHRSTLQPTSRPSLWNRKASRS